MSNEKKEITSSDPKKAAAQKKAKADADDIFKPPTILRDPASRQAQIGSRVVLRVTATGKPSPSYQWFHNGRKISGANTDRLTIVKARRSAAGAYHCEVRNFAGMATSRACMLSFLSKPVPKLVIGPAAPQVAEGQQLELRVTSPSVLELKEFKIYWVFNGMRIKGALGPLLRISAMKKKYEGSYKAMISAGGTLEMSNVVNVTLGEAALAPGTVMKVAPAATASTPNNPNDFFFNPEEAEEGASAPEPLPVGVAGQEEFGATSPHASPFTSYRRKTSFRKSPPAT